MYGKSNYLILAIATFTILLATVTKANSPLSGGIGSGLGLEEDSADVCDPAGDLINPFCEDPSGNCHCLPGACHPGGCAIAEALEDCLEDNPECGVGCAPANGNAPLTLDGLSSTVIGASWFTGAAIEARTDARLPSPGPSWIHARSYNSALDSTDSAFDTEQGWLWRHNLMTQLASEDESNYETSDITWIINAESSFEFENVGTDAWQSNRPIRLNLTHDVSSSALVLESVDGSAFRFRDFGYGTTALRGKLYEMRDAYGNTSTLTYSSGKLTRVDDVLGHRAVYSYVSGGVNDGKLSTIKVYIDQAETSANLIRQVDYTYASTNGASGFGWTTGDLIRARTRTKTTADAAGTLSIDRSVHYRYWTGTFNATTNPGTDHKLKYVVRAQNFDDLDSAIGFETATDAQVASYADHYLEYDSNYRVAKHVIASGCGSCGGGGDAGTIGYSWAVNVNNPTDVNTWAFQGIADGANGTRIIVDVNPIGKMLSHIFQDENDGSPNFEWINHYDYNSNGFHTRKYSPSACTSYNATTHEVTLASSSGFVLEYERFGSGDYEDYLKAVKVRKGKDGSPVTVKSFTRTDSKRPDLMASRTLYESDTSGGSDGRTTNYTYTFYDTDHHRLKQITETAPSVSAAKNGSSSSAVAKRFFDKFGHLRWAQDGEGFVAYFGYDDANTNGTFGTGRRTRSVIDVDTGTLITTIDNEWNGVEFGFAADDSVPFSRSGSGTALDLDSQSTFDSSGRLRSRTDAEGLTTWWAHKDGETRVYPAWDATSLESQLPPSVTKVDKDDNLLEAITLKTSINVNTNGSDEPDGTETLAQGKYVSWTVNTYSTGGELSSTKRYHNIPSSGSGTRLSNYYQTDFEYDNMGRKEYILTDVADSSPQDVEQVTQNVYDVLGRVTLTKRGVSGSNHDITSGKPTMNEARKFTFDNDGVGDGNLTASGVATHKSGIPSTMQFRTTNFEYDWRNRRSVTKPPMAPFSLVKYDNLNRVTASGTFSSATGLDPGDDPADSGLAANRVSLSKTHFDEVGRVYKTERFMDPTDATPADALTTNTYFDRRGLVWATDAANTGIRFTQFDGAGRRTASFSGTQFDTNKYASGAPDYPDDNEGIVEHTAFEFDDVGNVTKTVRKELNHNDTNGMDLDGTDFIRTYVYNWYDDAHRLTETANYGTNNASGWKDNSTAPTYGASAPARSDTVLVSSYSFDSSGRRDQVTDPKGNVTSNAFDSLGRTIAKTEDHGASALNRKTEYQYNGQGSLVRIIHDPDADNTFSNGSWTFAGSDTDQMTEYVYGDTTDAGWVTKILYPTGDGAAADTLDNRLVFAYRFDGAVSTRTDQNTGVISYTYDSLGRKTTEKVTTFGTGVDTAVRSVTWEYDNNGRLEYVTTHSDAFPDTSSYTDAVAQIKNTYDAAGNMTKQEQEPDGKVDASTKAVEMAYETDFTASGNYKRLKHLTYPDGTKIWRGYDNTGGASTFQDTINDKFSRIGQLAYDNAGSIGDRIVEYNFNGMRRMVRRDNDMGTAGSFTMMDLWQGTNTTGHYLGMDRFGRIAEMQVLDTVEGTAYDDRAYTYDRNGNPLTIENKLHKFRSMELTYDDLNRLTQADEGYLVSGALEKTDLARTYNMDLLGNLVDGFDQNGVADAFIHAVNASNEITELTRGNPAGQARAFVDPFTSLSNLWSVQQGTWSVSAGRLQVDSLPTPPPFQAGGPAEIVGPAFTDNGTVSAEFEIPSGGGGAMLMFARAAADEHWMVSFGNGSSFNITVYRSTPSNMFQFIKSSSGTINTQTKYIARVTRNQRHIEYAVLNTNGTLVMSDTYDATDDFGEGYFGLASSTVSVKFDDFGFTRLDQINPVIPQWSGTGKASLASATLNVQSRSWGGESILEWAGDDDYIAQADIDLNSGEDARLIVRYDNPDNYYAIEIGKDTGGGSGPIALIKRLRGKESTVSSTTYTTASSVTLKASVSGSTIKAWVGATLAINTTDGDLAAGGVALAGDTPKFDNVKVGYDNNADDDIDDAGDDLVVNDAFDATTVGFTYDDNGNLTNDGTYKYTYDAWNRLVKVTASSDTDIVIQTARFDGLGRRVRKVVTNSGDLDGTTDYYYNRNQIIETRDGSGNLVQQMVHGTQYIDELVGLRIADLGRFYVHQDANYNVVALSDMSGRFVERTYYSPYGQPEFVLDAHPFDYDDDGDVDATDIAAATTGGDCWGSYSGQGGDCKRLDADADRDIDAADHTVIVNYVNALPTDGELQRTPSSSKSTLENVFAHQGLILDSEIGSYQNRVRQYAPSTRRFVQRDPVRSSPLIMEDFVWVDDGLSQYQYVRCSPQRLNDMSGRAVCTGLFAAGGGCAGDMACTACNGDDGVVVCMSPIRFPAADENGGCDPNNMNLIERCVCQHENVHYQHRANGGAGCSKQTNGTGICVGAGAGAGFPPACDSCCRPRTEAAGYGQEALCLANAAPGTPAWDRLQFVRQRANRENQRLQRCLQNQACAPPGWCN